MTIKVKSTTAILGAAALTLAAACSLPASAAPKSSPSGYGVQNYDPYGRPTDYNAQGYYVGPHWAGRSAEYGMGEPRHYRRDWRGEREWQSRHGYLNAPAYRPMDPENDN